MAIGIIGTKVGMTRVFTESGDSIPVTVLQVSPNYVTQVKQDDYSAIQVTTGTQLPSRVNKSLKGHFAKAKVEAGRGLFEFRSDKEVVEKYALGDAIHLDLFKEGQTVDVTAVSKGKGFAGVVKRHNFSMQDATHGNSLSHRAHGSTGQCQDPGRVFKGKKMAGRMGGTQVTTQNLQIVRLDSERNVVLIKGAVPGRPGTSVRILPSIKDKGADRGN